MRPPQPWPGDPEAIWAAADPGEPPQRPVPPDLTAFEDFERLAAPPETAKSSAITLSVIGTVFLVWAVLSFAFRPEPVASDGGVVAAIMFGVRWHWAGVLVAAVWFLASAPRAYRKERRDHPREVRELHEAVCDRGVVAEVFPAGFKVLDSNGWSKAVIGVDARLDPASAARIRRAFRDWFAYLRSDDAAARKVRNRHGEREVRSAAEFFGPEAEGGYLIRHDLAVKPWMLLVPDPPNTSASWELITIDA